MSSAPQTGWVKLHRSILDWQWIGDPNVVVVFLQILLRVNRVAKRWQGIDIPPGSFVTSRETLAQSCGLSEKQVRRALEVLKGAETIGTERAGLGQMVSLRNWEEYQEDATTEGRTGASRRAEAGPKQGRSRAGTEEGREREKGRREESDPNGSGANGQLPIDGMPPPAPAPKIKPGAGPNPDVQAVVEFFEEQLGGKLDGTAQMNRWHASSLLKRLGSEFPEHDAVVSVKALIRAAREDDFHRRNATGFGYLLKHSRAIIESRKARASNPKTQTNGDRKQELATTLERRRVEREQAAAGGSPAGPSVPKDQPCADHADARPIDARPQPAGSHQ